MSCRRAQRSALISLCAQAVRWPPAHLARPTLPPGPNAVPAHASTSPLAHPQPARSPKRQAVSKKSLWDMGLQIFRAHLNQRAEVSRKTVQGLLALVERERNGDQVSPAWTETPHPTSRLEAFH